jgi:NAD(P)-dependent dehydrogenase (short-subunit alcohol dehydrogenase family)
VALTTTSFSLEGKTAVVTGGYGVIGGCLASGLAAAGAKVAVLGRRRDALDAKTAELRAAGGVAMSLVADAMDEAQLRAANDQILAEWGQVDILINGAGGSVQRARNDNSSIFRVPLDAFDEVLRLNLHGTVIPTMVFAESMAKRGSGSIVSISSMASYQALSGVLGYSVAKAGIDNFTRWMAVEMAREHGGKVRVNAIAPGFFVTTQNRSVLVDADGNLTARSKRIIDRTPMGRFGTPDELVGAVQWLCSDAAAFVTGVVIPVDGGFSAFSGV